jgi:hypothetical protein
MLCRIPYRETALKGRAFRRAEDGQSRERRRKAAGTLSSKNWENVGTDGTFPIYLL